MRRRFIFFFSLTLGIIAAYFGSGLLLDTLVSRAISKASTRFGQRLHIGSYHWIPLRTVTLKEISLTPLLHPSDTLLKIQECDIALRLLPLVKGSLELKRISLIGTELSLSQNHPGTSNFSGFSSLFHGSSQPVVQTSLDASTGWNELFQRSLKLVFSKIPDVITIKGLSISGDFKKDSLRFSLLSDGLTFEDNYITSSLHIKEYTYLPPTPPARTFGAVSAEGDRSRVRETSQSFTVQGLINRRRFSLDVSIYGQSEFCIPFIQQRFGVSLQASRYHFVFSPSEDKPHFSKAETVAEVENLKLYSSAIASDTIRTKKTSLKAALRIDPNSLAIEPESQLTLQSTEADTLTGSFSSWYDRSDSLQFGFHFKSDTLEANQFWQSLPTALRGDLGDLRFSGRAAYSLYLNVDTRNLDDILLEPMVYTDSFRVLSYGRLDFRKLNSPFRYIAKEKDSVLVREFEVGVSNPFYTPLEHIPATVIAAVLTNEDGSFFSHRGFNEGALAKAIGDNIRRERFARGGSTITMQLVKNIYLNRKKTVARKFQEICIVWLLERSGLVSKDRLLEIYLNIIEWGPDVYGLKEASRFYFSKDPKDLTLSESLFLSIIIPSPKRFFSLFQDGTLRKERVEQMAFLVGKMKERGFEADSSALGNLELRGASIRYLKRKPTEDATERESADALD